MKQNYFLAKWLNGEIDESTLRNHVSEEEIRSYKKIVAATKHLETPDFNAEETLEKIKTAHHTSKVKKLSFLKYTYRVAAMLAIVVSTFYFISNKDTVYSTNLAEKTSFELPDNSEVTLNADSEISYKTKNWENSRLLNLKGEAFFSVTKGSKFTVNTDLGKVQVLGTQFNVIVRDSYFEVHCFEGLVSATYKNKTIKVQAGTAFKVLNTTTEFIENNKRLNPSWILNESSFESMPYQYVVREVERQYDITIEYNNSLNEILFTGNFTHTNLEMALQAISIPLNLKYTIFSNNTVSLQ